MFQSTSGNRWGPLCFSLNSSVCEPGASRMRTECAVPLQMRVCGWSRAGTSLAIVQPCAQSDCAAGAAPRWARPPHAPASAASAAVLRSRGKIQFVIGTHADKTLGSCESGLTQPELVSNDDLTGGNVSHARTHARTRCATKKPRNKTLKTHTDGYSRHVHHATRYPLESCHTTDVVSDTEQQCALPAHMHVRMREHVYKMHTTSNAPCKGAKRNRCHSCVP
jgi:hypothetical protein